MNEGYGWNTVWIIIIMIAVVIGAYFTTKFIAKRSGRVARGRHIDVIDRMNIARDRQILLIEVAGKVMLIGVTNQAVNILETFDKDEFDTATEQTGQTAGGGAFGKMMGFFSGAKNADANFRKARAQYREEKQTAKKPGTPDDFLAKMNEAIAQRKQREMDDDGDKQ